MVGFDSFETKKATFITVKFNLDGFMKRYNTLSTLRRMAMGPIFIAAIVCMFACGDDSSSSIGPNDEQISEESSSSLKKLSSSSVILSVSEESSSSSAKSSSSSIQKNSSSSEKAKSSSSKEKKETKESSSSAKSSSSSSVILSASEESSSSSASLPNCSALLEGETGWSWDVPKECRFNPDITYDSMTDERDGKVYRIVKIGDLVWMAENLNYYDETNPSVKTKSWCYGKSDNKDSSTCDVAGRLYTWAAAIDSAKLYTEKSLDCGYDKTCALPDTVYGICPPGWHLPNNTEWNALFGAVGGVSTAGKVLKSRSGWNVSGNGSDAMGFSALPAGYKGNFSDLDFDGYAAYFWSSSEDNSQAYYMRLRYSRDKVSLSSDHKYLGFSVRCVMD